MPQLEPELTSTITHPLLARRLAAYASFEQVISQVIEQQSEATPETHTVSNHPCYSFFSQRAQAAVKSTALGIGCTTTATTLGSIVSQDPAHTFTGLIPTATLGAVGVFGTFEFLFNDVILNETFPSRLTKNHILLLTNLTFLAMIVVPYFNEDHPNVATLSGTMQLGLLLTAYAMLC